MEICSTFFFAEMDGGGFWRHHTCILLGSRLLGTKEKNKIFEYFICHTNSCLFFQAVPNVQLLKELLHTEQKI